MRRTLQSFLAVGVLVAGIAGTGSSAQAALVIAPLIGGGPGVASGTKYENFDDVTLGYSVSSITRPNGLSITFSDGGTDTGQTVLGSSGQYAAPFVQGNSGTLFGNASNSSDTTTYLTTGKTANIGPPPTGGSVTLNFATGQNYFGLLWGSVDTYNTLYFYDANGHLIDDVTGSEVSNSPNGGQGVNGSVYVNITSTVAFTKVVAASSNFAFEFDNVAFNDSTFLTPEPSTALMGLIAVGFVGLRRRMKKATSAV